VYTRRRKKNTAQYVLDITTLSYVLWHTRYILICYDFAVTFCILVTVL